MPALKALRRNHAISDEEEEEDEIETECDVASDNSDACVAKPASKKPRCNNDDDDESDDDVPAAKPARKPRRVGVGARKALIARLAALPQKQLLEALADFFGPEERVTSRNFSACYRPLTPM